MAARAVARRQPSAVDGRSHQCLAHALAVVVEKISGAVLIGEAVDREPLAAECQLGRDELARVHGLAVFVREALVHELESVAVPNVALEIHIPGIGADYLDQHRHRYAGRVAVHEEA